MGRSIHHKNVLLKTNVSGVSLLELVVVVAIIGFLGTLVFWTFRTQIAKGRDAKRKADIVRIQVAIEEYEKDNDCYPTPISILNCDPGSGLRPYLNKIPCDPTSNTSYTYEPETSSCPRWYRIYANLENQEDPIIEKLGCTYGCGPGLIFSYYAANPSAPTPERGVGP